jgi:23S rRNA (guanine2535-N1)-methyltransferase
VENSFYNNPMPYRYPNEDLDYTDFASGRVIYNQPGAPAFPVRLASEIFQRAMHAREQTALVRLYDPVCGGAYHLAALGFLHGREIQSITASDIDEQAITLATRNLGLLSPTGLDRREEEIRHMLAEFGKESHAGALESLSTLRRRLDQAGHLIETRVFRANALDASDLREMLSPQSVDLVISDVPYGQLSSWQPAGQQAEPPLWQMLEALLPVLTPGAVVAIAADKAQKIAHPAYRRIERFQVGKRQVSLLQNS